MGTKSPSDVRGAILPPVVIAGTYPQFLAWCHENKVSPINGAIFSQDPMRLKGLQGNPIVRVGTWNHNPCAYMREVLGKDVMGGRS